MNKNHSIDSVPSAFITKNKQRVRQHGNNIYLKNGDEFEIELFNPLQKSILAKIKLNGEFISSTGLILKPGQRIFLERYFDKPNKFKFEAYEVESSPEALHAIKVNGLLDVMFYLESREPDWLITTTSYPYCVTSQTGSIWGGSPYGEAYGGTLTGDITFATNVCTTTAINSYNFYTSNASVETGRVEQGSYSNQNFTSSYEKFNQHYSYSSSWKILPASLKPHDSKDIKLYCHECGTRIKKSTHKFCYNCGTSLK